MCGIIGIIHHLDNGFDYEAKNALIPMLLLNSMRGPHSTGLFGVKKGDKKEADTVDWIKRVGVPHNIFAEKDGQKFMGKVFSDYQAVIGHGRYATQGKVNAQNAHPFTHENITLVHNGSLRNLYSLRVNNESMSTKFEVDSEAIAYMFSQLGVKDTLKEMSGALSLIWYDKRTKMLHAIRNSERPMFIARRKTSNSGVFFSSEIETLRYVQDKFSGITFEDPLLFLEPECLYSFPIGSAGSGKKWLEREKVKMGPQWSIPVYQPRYNQERRGGFADFGMYGDMDDLFDANNTNRETVHSSRQESAGTNIVPFRQRENMSAAVIREALKRAKQVKNQESGTAKVAGIERFGIKFRVGQLVAFYPDTFEPIGKNEKDIYTFIRGRHVLSDKIEVAVHYKEKADLVKSEIVLVGKIKVMHHLEPSKAQGKVFRIYVEEIQRVSETIQNLIVQGQVFVLEDEMKKHPFIELDDGTSLREESGEGRTYVVLKSGVNMVWWEWERDTGFGCAKCGGEIAVTEPKGCLKVNDVATATAKEKTHGGLYCPDCVTHHFSN